MSPRLKVLMTTDAVGGVWTYALTLAAALAKHGVEITLAAMGPLPSAVQRDDARRLSNVRLECAAYKLEWMQDPWDEVDRAADWLLDIAARDAVDVVHLNGYAHAALPWRRPVVVVAHSCVASWWRAVHGVAPPREWDTYIRRVSQGLACADAVVAPTRTFLATLRAMYGALPDGRVIHNAGAPELFQGGDADGRLPIVFACGRFWDEAKNMRALDAAAQGLPWRVYAAGNSLAPDGRCSQSQALCCLGVLAARDLAVWLRRAAIFAHPARYEPFGLAVLEAAQAGCALVLADLPGLRELWLDAALYVDPNDASALHAALRELIEDSSRRALLGKAARERACAFVPDRMADEYHTLYRNLLSRQPAMERAIA